MPVIVIEGAAQTILLQRGATFLTVFS